MSAAQKIWILEQYQAPLRLIKEDKDEQDRFIFEGPCADFNGENDNGRYYDKDDYLSHFSYLQPQIEANSLAGELDHADDYNPKMKDLSHVVRKLWFREDLNQVWIRIELFDEGEGRKAIGYAKKGFPLYISSRASGYIDDDGNVTLDTIYTYDIVYRPGFKVAELKRSGNSSEAKIIKLHESSQKYSNQRSTIMLLEWKEPKENDKINNKKKITSDMEQDHKDINKTATIGDLDKIYEAINGQFNMLKKSLNINDENFHMKSGLQFMHENKGGKNNSEIIKKIEENLSDKFASKNDIDDLNKKLEFVLQWSELVRKAINEQDAVNKKHHKHINMVTNRINNIGDVDSGEIIAQLKKDTTVLKKYADINTEIVNKMADKQDLIHEHANLTTKAVNDITENVSEQDGSIEKIKSNISTINEHANLSTGFINDINKKVKTMSKKINEELDTEKINGVLAEFNGGASLVGNDILLTDPTIADKVSSALASAGFKNTKESETKLIINEELDEKTGEVKTTAPANIDPEKINKVLGEFDGGASLIGNNIIFTDPEIIDVVASALSSAGVKNTKDDNKLILESKVIAKTGKGKIDIKKIGNRVDESILSTKKKIAEKVIDTVIEKYPYVAALENSEIVLFSKLNDVKKKIISDKVYESGVDSRGDVLNIVRSVNSDRGVVRMLSNMPNKVKPIWNSLEKRHKQQITSLYNIKTFGNDLEVKAWWESMNIGDTNLQKIDENLAAADVELIIGSDSDLGYSTDDITSSLKI